jgi:hypothetical protein
MKGSVGTWEISCLAGWCQPRRSAAGGAEAKRAFDAMMDMGKIDVAAIVAARRG